MTVPISWGCHDKCPQTGWLDTTEVRSLPVLEARSLRRRAGSPRGSAGESVPRLSPSSWRLPESSALLFFRMGHCSLCPCRPMTFSMWQMPLRLSLTRTFTTGFRVYPNSLGWSHLKILTLIIPAKMLFPSEVTFAASKGQDIDIPSEWPLFNPLRESWVCLLSSFCPLASLVRPAGAH